MRHVRTNQALGAIAVVACAAIAVPQIATGARKKTYKVDLNMRTAVIKTVGNRSVAAGRLTGRVVRTPAILIKSKTSESTITSTTVSYGRAGTINGKSTQEVTPQPDGSLKFTGTPGPLAEPAGTRAPPAG